MYAEYIKRILDFLISIFLLIFFSPLLLIISICILVNSGRPIFFLQKRLGKNGRIFHIIKFRTMIVNAENIGDGLKIQSENDNRITTIGKILRKTSLDELPQLINVIKGDMSLIGPRPPVTYFPHYYADYNDYQKQRFSVKPGITGLAQATVRNSATWDQKIDIDIIYVQKISFLLDLKILYLTFLTLFNRDKVYISSRTQYQDKSD